MGPKTQILSVLLAVGLLVLAGVVPSRAQSPWEAMARMLNPDPTTPERAPEVPDEQGTATASLNSMSRATTIGRTSDDVKLGEQAFKSGRGGEDGLDLGLESDPNQKLYEEHLFEKPEVRRLLGEQPRFLYNAQNLPDPMVVPWVRRAAIYKELSVAAEHFVQEEHFDKAIALYRKILEMDDPRYNAIVHSKLDEIAMLQREDLEQIEQARTEARPVIELPPWLYQNTTGVIVDPRRELCLVGDYMLAIGDPVPNYPEVTVSEINRQSVTYRIKNQSFVVHLQTAGGMGMTF